MTVKRKLKQEDDTDSEHARKYVSTKVRCLSGEESGSDDLLDEFFNDTDDSSQFSQSDSNSVNGEDSDSEIGSEVDIDDIPWEDVSLGGEIEVTVDIGAEKGTAKDSAARAKRTANIRKRKQLQYVKNMKYGLHLTLIPFMLKVLQTRLKWAKDVRLNRRLKRSVPKLICKKFSEWAARDKISRDRFLRTLLLGLVMWFRSNFRVNSNGFRQNFGRLDTLIGHSSVDNKSSERTPLLAKVLDNPEIYYGSRPTLNLHDAIDDIRNAAKKKMANRDILTLFFLVILKNIIPHELLGNVSFCFALPLIEFEDLPNCDMYEIPNRFDSDLLQPNFWIELQLADDLNSLYVIDPVVKLDKSEIVSKFKIDEPVPYFEPIPSSAYTTKQYFRYVVKGNLENGSLTDVSPRYIRNLCYRYFPLTQESQILSSRHYRSYVFFRKMLKRTNQGGTLEDAALMRKLAFKNYELPKSLKELRKSNNFIARGQLRKSQYLISKDSEFLKFLNGSILRNLPETMINGKKVALYWKNQVINLKSEQRWLILGRSVIKGEEPLRQEQHPTGTLRNQEDRFKIRNLFAWEQTRQTPKLPSYYHDSSGVLQPITDVDFYRNKYGNIEIFSESTKPDGFELVKLNSSPGIRGLIKRYNRGLQHKIKYLDVVSGFDFKERKGFAIPIVDRIMLNERDYKILLDVVIKKREEAGLQKWLVLLNKLKTKERLDKAYG